MPLSALIFEAKVLNFLTRLFVWKKLKINKFYIHFKF